MAHGGAGQCRLSLGLLWVSVALAAGRQLQTSPRWKSLWQEGNLELLVQALGLRHSSNASSAPQNNRITELGGNLPSHRVQPSGDTFLVQLLPCPARTRGLSAGSRDGHGSAAGGTSAQPGGSPAPAPELRASSKSLPAAKESGIQSNYILRCMRHQRGDNTTIAACEAPVEHFHSCCRQDGALPELLPFRDPGTFCETRPSHSCSPATPGAVYLGEEGDVALGKGGMGKEGLALGSVLLGGAGHCSILIFCT